MGQSRSLALFLSACTCLCAARCAAAYGLPAEGFCEGDGWEVVEVEDVSPLFVGDIFGNLWPVLGYDTGGRWEGCLLDELETAAEGCTQAVGNSIELAGLTDHDGGALLPPDSVVWWLALNQTCPYHSGSWKFVEVLAAAAANSSLIAVMVSKIDTSDTGLTGSPLDPSQESPCGGPRQFCCMQGQALSASCAKAGLVCMEHGPDIICEEPRCAAPAAVEGRPGVFACPAGAGGPVMLVGTLVGAGGS